MNSLETEDEYFILYVFVINMMIEKWEVLFDDITKVIKISSIQIFYSNNLFKYQLPPLYHTIIIKKKINLHLVEYLKEMFCKSYERL